MPLTPAEEAELDKKFLGVAPSTPTPGDRLTPEEEAALDQKFLGDRPTEPLAARETISAPEKWLLAALPITISERVGAGMGKSPKETEQLRNEGAANLLGFAVAGEVGGLGVWGKAARAATSRLPLGAVPAARALTGALSGAAAGGAQSVISGEPLREGEGLPTLRSKILWGAGVGGGLGAAAGVAEQGFRLLGRALNYANQVRGLDDVAAGVAEAPEGMVLRTLRQYETGAAFKARRSEAARSAYRALLPKPLEQQLVAQHGAIPEALKKQAISAAKEAAGKVTIQTTDDVVRSTDVLLGAQAFADNYGSLVERGPDVRYQSLNKAGEAFKAWLVNAGRVLRNDKLRFGTVGEAFANDAERMYAIREGLEGERRNFTLQAIKGLSRRERFNVTDVLEGKAPAATPRVAEAVKKLRDLDDMIFAEGKATNLREIDQELSRRASSLNPDEVEQLKRLLAGGGTGMPRSVFPDKVWRLATDIQGAGGSVLTRRAGGLDAVLVPLRYMPNHVPRYYPAGTMQKVMTEGTPEYQGALASVKRLWPNLSDSEAKSTLRDMWRGRFFVPGEVRGGPLQWSRELVLGEGYERDAAKWLPKYVADTSMRLAQGKVFGGQDQRFYELLDKLEQGGGTRYASDVMTKVFLGLTGRSEEMGGLGRFLSTASTVRYLGLRTALLQYMQLANPVAAFGFRNTLRSLPLLMESNAVREMVRDSGALLPSVHHAIDADALSTTASWWVHLIGMMKADKQARGVTAVAGALDAQQIARQLAQMTAQGKSLNGIGAQAMLRRLALHGVTLREVIEAKGELDPEVLKRVMLGAANRLQHAGHVTDLPWARNTAAGKWLLKFRTFTLQQGKFIDDYLLKEARRGNLAPLTRYLLVMGVHGTMLGKVFEMMSNPGRRREGIDQARDVLNMLAFGMFADATAQALEGREEKFAQWMIGAPAGLALGGPMSVVRAARQGSPQPVIDYLTPNVLKQLYNLAQRAANE